MNAPIDVLVTAIGGFSHGEQVLKALLRAPEGRYRIHGADASACCPQFAKVESAHQLPMARDANYLDSLLSLCKRLDVKVLIHGCEPELEVLSANRELFRQEGILVPINRADVIDTCMNKTRINKFLLDHGFSAPNFLEVDSADEIDAVEDFPVVVKPRIGGGGSRNVFITQNRDELAAVYRLVGGATGGGGRLMVQEYVGRPEAEYTIGVLHDLDGNFVNSIALRRRLDSSLNLRLSVENRTSRTDLGRKLVISSGISHGEVGRFPEVARQCEEIAAALGSAGPVNIQARLVDGEVKVFEINPRFSGTTSVRAAMGFNEPDLLIRRHLLGERLQEGFAYREGLVLRSLCETEITDAHYAH